MRGYRSTFQSLIAIVLLTACWPFLFVDKSQASSQQSDEPLFPIWNESGKEGFIDASGNTVIAPRFEKVMGFTDGMAAVRYGDKWGYIDRTGKLVIAPRWKEVYAFSDGVAAIVDGIQGYAYTPLPENGDGFELGLKACGYIDKSGRYIIEPSIERKMSQCSAFIDGLSRVCFEAILTTFFPDFAEAGLCGYINKAGSFVIKPQFEAASDFAEGLALVRLRRYDDKGSNAWLNDFAFIDKTGKSTFDLKGYSDAHSFHEGLAQVSTRIGKISFVDRTGQSRFEVNAIKAGDFSNGRALVQDLDTKLYGYVEASGKWVIPPRYTEAESFSDSFALVCTEPGQCGYINLGGNVVITHGGDPFLGGLVLRYLYTRTIHQTPDHRNIYGYMNKAGKYVWVSPGGESFLGRKWWRENYIGPHMPTSFPRQ